ncbi:uncharacterized protein [Diadema setosum]|uniref:uncharacterized protein n=1 Tax=Diadema setosum TaxID=31175 RepID=UPI003B3B2570
MTSKKLIHVFENPQHAEVSEHKIARSDVERLAMLRERAERESGNCGWREFLQIFAFLLIACSFSAAFYKMACMNYEIQNLRQQLARVPDTRVHGRDDFPQRDLFAHHDRFNHTSMFRGHHERARRSVSGSGESTNRSHESNAISKIPFLEEHPVIHLVPKNLTGTISLGEVFEWEIPNEFRRSPGFELVNNRSIVVPAAGYYFVYSQVTFADKVGRAVGHMIARTLDCGRGKTRIVMRTELTQHARSDALEPTPRDSTYIGGIVYLLAGDQLSISPVLGITMSVNVSTSTDAGKETFCGAYMIAIDETAPSITDACK